ncbi:MAG: ATP-binding protein [Rhodothermales bacterium]
MADAPDIAGHLGRDRLVRFAVVAGLLAVLLPATWIAREIHVHRVEAEAAAQTEEAVAQALDQIARHFSDLLDDLVDRAEHVATSQAVIEAMRTRGRAGARRGPESVVRYFANLDVPYGASVELYDANRELVAWNGFSMPLDEEGSAPSFRTALVSDGDLREALVVWYPVRSGSTVNGSVRAMHLVGYDAPVRNEYIRDVSLVNEWRRLTQLPVTLTLGGFADAGGASRLLRGSDGRVLGRVSVDPPSVRRLAASTAGHYDHVLAFWSVLLLFWLMGGAWFVYRRTCASKSAVLPRDEPRAGRLVAFALIGTLWWMVRFALLALDVPGRWQQPREPLAPLFDPIHFASGIGGGLLRSSGDFLITALFLLVFAIAFVDLAKPFGVRCAERLRRRDSLDRSRRSSGLGSGSLAVVVGTFVVVALTLVLALVARHVVLDSTFDFFTRRGLVPESLLLVVSCTLIVATIGIILLSVGVVWLTAWAASGQASLYTQDWTVRLTLGLSIASPVVLFYALTPVHELVPWPVMLSALFVAGGLAVFVLVRTGPAADLFILRRVLPAVFLVSVMLYPMLFGGMDLNRRTQMVDAATTFAEARDPRVRFALEQIISDLRADPSMREILAAGDVSRLDSVGTSAFRGTLISVLPSYSVYLTFFDADGRALARYFDTGQRLDTASVRRVEPLAQNILHMMYEEAGGEDVVVAPITGQREPDRFQFGGIAPVTADGSTVGWITARAEPQSVLREGGAAFPSVLLPSGAYDDLFANLSVAEFRNGILVRSMGRDFGRYRLSEEILTGLAAESSLWRSEVVDEREYRTYYLRHAPSSGRDVGMPTGASGSVIAVRAPGINTFDHLYYLLRLTVAGLFIGVPLYLFGLYYRRREGVLPAPRVRFRDKVLNAFLGVGIISVAAVGIVGVGVVNDENERAVHSWLQQHLERVEEALALAAREEEMPYSVLRRTRIDSLAASVGLDLNVYENNYVVDLSRPQLVREAIIDERLPIEAYEALYFDGFRFVHTHERVGTFRYTAGFRALPDEQGRPRYVVSVPTLPEQERIEEERARTVAYLFGSLLLLMLVVMLTASLLANAISRPIARLRSGLKAVAAGRFEQMLPVDTRDEVGELVETFNEMQAQLAESRRKLAQQERQLAWREMARQVAHEIKNPLTPMKLSVQHLRRAFEHRREDEESGKPFSDVFNRITSTLIEQIDSLARIANEFHSFARMPSRIIEHLDLNNVVDEAVSLMQEESDIPIDVELSATPLVVEADREELRRNFINLIKNALQAIPEDAEGRVRVRTERRSTAAGAWAYSAVRDSGTGIEADVQDRIFEPNFSTKTSGTGLGLAIVKKSVEELQGEIGFETEEGEGTTFWIRLPLADER